MTSTLAGLLDFIILFVVATALIALYLAIYTLATMHNEFALIRHNVISAATSWVLRCRLRAPSSMRKPSWIA
jgi:putative membrane protein